MFADNNLILSGSISSTGTITYQTPATTSTTLSTNTVDLGTARDMGEGEDLFMRVLVGTAFAGGTSTEFQVITADDAALTSNVTVIGTTGAILTASLTAGARFACQVNPRLGSKSQRYLGARYSVTGTNTAGTAFIDLGAEIQDGQKFYASGIAIL